MGLDMYLTRNIALAKNSVQVALTQPLASLEPLAGKYNTISQQAMYWRKANAIHGWFCRQLTEDGSEIDNLRNYHITIEELKQLKNTCVAVHRNPEHASLLMPTRSGFFFGGTEYDEHYFAELTDTIKMVEAEEQLIEELGDILGRNLVDVTYEYSVWW